MAPGGVASKNGRVYMRVQGGFNFLWLVCPSVRLSVRAKVAVSFSKNGLRERLRVCRGESRNQLRGLALLWEGHFFLACVGSCIKVYPQLFELELELIQSHIAQKPMLRDLKEGG